MSLAWFLIDSTKMKTDTINACLRKQSCFTGVSVLFVFLGLAPENAIDYHFSVNRYNNTVLNSFTHA